jgi:hypothetical protein
VTSLETRLYTLGHELDYPAEPDLTSPVLARLDRRPFPWRRAAALAFALVAVAVGAAFAVPQARTAILRFFHIGGENIVRVEKLPPAVERSQAGGLGTPLSLTEAQRRLGFQFLFPPFKGAPPNRVYVLGDAVGSVIVRSHGLRVLLSEFNSAGAIGLKKLTLGETTAQWLRINGRDAIWLHGGTHTLTYFNRRLEFQEQTIKIHGNVLVWVR